MMLHTLLPTALLFLAIIHNRHCRAHAMHPKNPSSFPSTFVAPKGSSANNIVRLGRMSGRRRVVIRSQPPTAEEGDDTFFFRASQQAAQRRMQQLKYGQEPLAISLSSAAGGGDDGDSRGKMTEGGSGETSDEGDHEENAQPATQPPSQEVKISVDPFLTRQRRRESITSQPGDDFQRKLLEARLLMAELAKSSNAGKDLETSNAHGEADLDTVAEALSSSVAAEEEITNSEPGRSVATLGEETDTTNKLLDSKTGAKTMEGEHATVARLSSDGKEIFEPSPTSLEVDQQKVEMGLLVLTRSLLTLKSILEKDEPS